MGEVKKGICHICLTEDDESCFVPLDEPCKKDFKQIVPELDLDAFKNSVICNICSKLVREDFCNIKEACSKTNQFIKKQIESQGTKDKLNLNQAVKSTTGKTCRICSKTDKSKYVSITEAQAEDLFTTALKSSLPELDAGALALTVDPIICEECQDTVRRMHRYKTECLSVEKKLKQYRETNSESEVDMEKFLAFVKAESKKTVGDDNFLSEFDVQDEEEADIFDIFPNFSADGSASEAKGTDKKTPDDGKKPKKEVEDDGLPYFNFNFNLIFNPKTEGTMEEWLVKVDEAKNKLGWSDYVTIHKVLAKLKGMEDLYKWFSSISEIMNWNEWRQKLVQMFPPQNDFYIKLKRMFNRKKRPFETYVEYYNAKLPLIQDEDLKISGEKAVSCMIGGITDITVGCIARVGNYKTPEELLEYLKSVNEKKNTYAESKSKEKTAENKTPQTAAEKKLDKKKRVKCYICRRYGHSAKECWETSKTVANGTANKAKPANTPKSARTKPKPKGRCVHCGNFGHTNQACPKKSSAKPQAQGAKAGRVAPSRARFVSAAEKKSVKVQQSQKKERGARCHNCGKFGHLQSVCRSKGKAPPGSAGGFSNRAGRLQERDNERFFSREMLLDRLQEDNSRIVCFKCFRIGHDARDCIDFGGRAFRN